MLPGAPKEVYPFGGRAQEQKELNFVASPGTVLRISPPHSLQSRYNVETPITSVLQMKNPSPREVKVTCPRSYS